MPLCKYLTRCLKNKAWSRTSPFYKQMEKKGQVGVIYLSKLRKGSVVMKPSGNSKHRFCIFIIIKIGRFKHRREMNQRV